jgi:hypothetical protein
MSATHVYECDFCHEKEEMLQPSADSPWLSGRSKLKLRRLGDEDACWSCTEEAVTMLRARYPVRSKAAAE